MSRVTVMAAASSLTYPHANTVLVHVQALWPGAELLQTLHRPSSTVTLSLYHAASTKPGILQQSWGWMGQYIYIWLPPGQRQHGFSKVVISRHVQGACSLPVPGDAVVDVAEYL